MATVTAKKTSDIAAHTARQTTRRKRNATARDAKTLAGNFDGKKFGDLTPLERTDLLKVVALRLGLVEPD